VSLTAGWAARWRDEPDRVVLVDAQFGTACSAADLETLSAVVAHVLSALGVRPGDRVVLSCAPSVETVFAYVGILRLGAVVVPANTAYTSAELAHIVHDVRPVTAVVDDPDRFPGLPIAARTTALARRTPIALGLVHDVPLDLDATGDDGAAMIAFTSGTTGRSKGAVLSHGNLRAGAEALVDAWGWTPDDRLVHALPMFHMHGLGAAINGSLTAGASMVVLPRFDPAAVVDAAAEHDATMFFGVPTMYARLRDTGHLAELSGLRLLVSGSAPLDPALFQAIAASTGQAPIERYGMSETVMLTSNPLHGERRAGSVGLPLPGVQVRLGEGGSVEVTGPNVFAGYWERPEANAEAFTADGWFRTGDIGELDPDGHLRLVGRASDLIITGGYNVYPREVEDAVLEHPAVADAAVVGIPDDTWGETVAAYVVLREDLAAHGVHAAGISDALTAHVETRLAAYKRPRSWTVVAELPRNAMGKVRRDLLREQGMMAP
jgi:malonyl-CoA/methylmalonyl-CoA synthetase